MANMNTTPKPKLTKEEQKAATKEAHEASERIHSLVVKIISWKAGILDGAVITESNKITKREWEKYRQHILRISKTESVEKVKDRLKETQQSIQSHNGFEF
jgi:hypothetical protein